MAGQLQPPHHPVSLSAIGSQRLDHLFVGAPRASAQSPSDQVLQVVVPDGQRVGVTERDGTGHRGGPSADAGNLGQRCGVLRPRGGARPVRDQKMPGKTDMTQGLRASTFDAQVVQRGVVQSGKGVRRRWQAQISNGARGALAVLHDQVTPLACRFQPGDPLAENGGNEFVVGRQTASEPQAGESALGICHHLIDTIQIGAHVARAEQLGDPFGQPWASGSVVLDSLFAEGVHDADGSGSLRGPSGPPERIMVDDGGGVVPGVTVLVQEHLGEHGRSLGCDGPTVVVARWGMAEVEISHPREGVALVTLNRPASLNAMTSTMVTELHDALDAIATDRDVRVVVLTGSGRGFCAGLDLNGYGQAPGFDWHGRVEKGLAVQKHIASLIPHMRSLPQPIISAVNGPASGGGFALVLGSDIRLAAESAVFNAAFIRIGLSACDIGTSWLLPRLVGAARAQELMLTGRLFAASEALAMGLVTAVVEDSALLTAAFDKATEVMANTPLGVALTKEGMWSALEIPGLQAAIDMENRQQIMASFSDDAREAQLARREKRAPRYSG